MLRLELSSMTVKVQFVCANGAAVMGSDQNCDALNTFAVLSLRFFRFHPALSRQQANFKQQPHG